MKSHTWEWEGLLPDLVWSEAWADPLWFWKYCTSGGRLQGRSCDPRRFSTVDTRSSIRFLCGADTYGNSLNFVSPNSLFNSIWDDDDDDAEEQQEEGKVLDLDLDLDLEELGGKWLLKKKITGSVTAISYSFYSPRCPMSISMSNLSLTCMPKRCVL